MMSSDVKQKVLDKLKKGKYVLIVVLLGLVLILWPQEKEAEVVDNQQMQDDFSIEQEEKKIADALSEIDGAGDVNVVLTLQVSTQNVLAEDTQTSTQEDSDGKTSETSVTTVIVSPKSSQQQAVVLQRIYPEYRGALIVAQGADDPAIKLAITQAVAGLTGLSSDKITVVKMKGN